MTGADPHGVSLAERIDARMAAARKGRPALVVDDVVTDQAALAQRIRQAWSLFDARGLGPGDRLAILSRSVLDMATVMLAAIRDGVAVVNLDPDISARDAAIALGACRPTLLVADRDILDAVVLPQGLAVSVIEAPVRPAATGAFAFLRRAAAPHAAGFAAELAACIPGEAPPPPPAGATAMMLFTSGTTSAPKVVTLSQAALAAQIAAFETVFGYDEDCRILNPLPLHFTDGMLHGPIAAFLAGATLYRPARFDFRKLDALIAGVYRDRITHLIVVPALLSMLDRLGDAFVDAFDTPDFRFIRSSGDLLPETLWRAVERRFGVRVVNTYGMSETVCEALYAGPDDATRRIGTIGKPVGCEIRIVDDAGLPVAAGETGELQIRGALVMSGYLDQPALTAAAFDGDWLRTGDLAAMDGDGFVRIVGRRKSLIISGGVNIQPQDIADCLLDHPAVAEVAVLGLPHQLWGEQVGAAVVLRPGAQATPEALRAHCAATLSPHKTPRVVVVMPSLPRNPAGKVLAEPLRAALLRLDVTAGSVAEADTAETVRRIAAQVFAQPFEDIQPSASPATTPGWDSLAHMRLIGVVEERFGIRLDVVETLRIDTLADLTAVVQRRLGGGDAEE